MAPAKKPAGKRPMPMLGPMPFPPAPAGGPPMMGGPPAFKKGGKVK